MQYQVNPKELSPKNGQKPPFWLSGSFKNAFLTLRTILHDLSRFLNVETHLDLSSEAISSRSKRPKSRKPPFWHFGSFKNAFL